MESQWKHKISGLRQQDFEPLALEVFLYQYGNNPIYRQYTDTLRIDPAGVDRLEKIPFLPIRFFKSHAVRTTEFDPAVIFESSGTTGSVNSRHYVRDTSLYKESFTKGFEYFYGPARDWCILGLLPSYLERKNSSLVYMVNELARQSKSPASGFYLKEFDRLFETLKGLERAKQKTILVGVSFALLDFAGQYTLPLRNTIIMETGGMKGRRKEMVRDELHAILKKSFSASVIHSEYGMTELLSQAYSKGDGIFHCPPWMRVLTRDETDPFVMVEGQAGIINIIDLANIYSCSFIATDDAGRLYADGSFRVLGRIDNSDLRGCSLMTL